MIRKLGKVSSDFVALGKSHEKYSKVLVSIFILTKFEILTNILQLGTILNQER